jgi:hypothetical protein
MRGHSRQPQQWPAYRLCSPGTVPPESINNFLLQNIVSHAWCCGSGMFIPDQTAAPKEGGDLFFLPFFSVKYHNIVNKFIFEQAKKFFKAKTLSIKVNLSLSC